MQLRDLKFQRERKGLTQAELAAQAGVSPRTVAGHEASPSNIRADTARKLSDALGVEIDDLKPERSTA